MVTTLSLPSNTVILSVPNSSQNSLLAGPFIMGLPVYPGNILTAEMLEVLSGTITSPVTDNEISVHNAFINGDYFPYRILSGSSTTLGNVESLTVYQDEIFVSVYDGATGYIAVFDINSNGNDAPKRVISGASTELTFPKGIFVYQDEIFVSNLFGGVKVFNHTDNGNVAPKRTFSVTGVNNYCAIFVYQDEIYGTSANGSLVGEPGHYVVPLAASGATAPTRQSDNAAFAGNFGLVVVNDVVIMSGVNSNSLYFFDKDETGTVTVDRTITGFDNPASIDYYNDELFIFESSVIGNVQKITIIDINHSSGVVSPKRQIFGTKSDIIDKEGSIAVYKNSLSLIYPPGPFYSLPTSAVTITVPDGNIASDSPVLSKLSCSQSVSGDSLGRSSVILTWEINNGTEVFSEILGKVSSSVAQFETRLDPVIESSFSLYEITHPDPGGYPSTFISSTADVDHDVITVDSSSGFSVGDFVRIGFLSSSYKYSEIKNINGNKITLSSRLNKQYSPGEQFKKVVSVLKTETTDYSINFNTGVINIVLANFVLANDIVVFYRGTITTIDEFELYLVPGLSPVPPSDGYSLPTKSDVVAFPTVRTVSSSIGSSVRALSDVFITSDNGESFTYYLFVFSDSQEGFPLVCEFETIPSIPNLLLAAPSDNAVLLSWSSLSSTYDSNVDGFNVFRNEGSVFDPQTAIKINSVLIPRATVSFDDSSANSTNRVSSSVAPFPVNGGCYSYKVEAEDTVTSYSTGTQNQISGQSEVAEAIKL